MRHKTGKGQQPPKLNRYQKEELITKVIRWMCEHKNRSEIIIDVQTVSPVKINYNDALKVVQAAEAQLAQFADQDAEIVIRTHLELYNQILAYFQFTGNPSGINKAMKQREKLMGLHKAQKITINRTKNIVIHKAPEYDMGKLQPHQLERLKELQAKAAINKES